MGRRCGRVVAGEHACSGHIVEEKSAEISDVRCHGDGVARRLVYG
jgi:hypothetical protein